MRIRVVGPEAIMKSVHLNLNGDVRLTVYTCTALHEGWGSALNLA
jgi:hypothetical protein